MPSTPARRAHDLAALSDAKPLALAASRALVTALQADADVQTLTRLAHAAARATGLLWECAARVSE